MLSSGDIGKRINQLRRERKISQEKMAEDLGMYQADISNLEHASNGSGISNIQKLEQIAEYFGMTLREFLFDESIDFSPERGGRYKDHVISDVIHETCGTYHFSEARLESPEGECIYISFTDDGDSLFFLKTVKRLRDLQGTKCLLNSFLSGKSYLDIFEDAETDDLDICRYLIFVATEKRKDADRLINDTTGKTLGSVTVPVPGREPEDLMDVDYSDRNAVYRYRLMIECCLKSPSLYSDEDDIEQTERIMLKKLTAACSSEDAYQAWKKNVIDENIPKITEKHKMVVCPYLFAGIGRYEEILPEEQVESFMSWIDGCGSALASEPRPATEEEIRTYVGMHLADSLLGIESPLA